MRYKVIKFFHDMHLGNCLPQQIIELTDDRAINLITMGYIEPVFEDVVTENIKKENTNNTKLKKKK